MARTPEQRGPFGRWLVSERKTRGWTADEMRARLREARGFAMAHSTYALIESGQRLPTDEQRAHLTAFLGSEPRPTEQGAREGNAPDLATLLAAMERQAADQSALIGELRAQNDLLRQLVQKLSDATLVVPAAEPDSALLPRPGHGRAVRVLAAMQSVEEPESVPASDPGTAPVPRPVR